MEIVKSKILEPIEYKGIKKIIFEHKKNLLLHSLGGLERAKS